MRTLIVAAAAALISIAPPPSAAAPKAEQPSECSWYWDIAITARAYAMEGVERETTRRAVWRVFATPVDRMRAIGNAVVDAVYSTPWAENERPGDLAGKLQQACLETGDMDKILGTAL